MRGLGYLEDNLLKLILWTVLHFVAAAISFHCFGEEYASRFEGIILAACLAFAGLCLCWSSSSSGCWAAKNVSMLQQSNAPLVIAGPFAYVRHPMYLGFLCLHSAPAFLLHPVCSIVIFLVFSAHWVVLCKVDERSLRNMYGLDYERYTERVPMLFPQFLSIPSLVFTLVKNIRTYQMGHHNQGMWYPLTGSVMFLLLMELCFGRAGIIVWIVPIGTAISYLKLGNQELYCAKMEPPTIQARIKHRKSTLDVKPNSVTGFLDIQPNGKLWYFDSKSPGPVIVLVHSGALGASGWERQQVPLIKDGFRVVTYARRGHLPSVSSEGDSAGYLAVDDLKLLVSHLDLQNFHLVGAAKGGWFALDYTLECPERVSSLTLVSSQLNLQEPDWLTCCKRLKPSFFAELSDDFKELSPSYRAGFPEGHDVWMEKHAAVQDSGLQSTTKHIIDWAALKRVSAPVLLMTGDSDLYVPPSMLRMQGQHFSNVTMIIVPESGHNPYWENPSFFNERLLYFLRLH
jgi:pimeloyl-ACP methyl ester carboxylesterase/protein-S-isoprenylcysteine O-methyltransferase Ste14